MDGRDDRVFKDMETLASGGSVDRIISMTPTFGDLHRSSDGVYTLRAAAGYLRIVKEDRMHRLSIPNRDLFTVFASEIVPLAEIRGEQMFGFADAVLSCDTVAMERILGDLMTDAVSARVLSDEHAYQMFITGFLMSHYGRHRITADFESGDGYRDIRMERIPGTGANVAMEFKKAHSEDDLAHLAEEALAQIRDRRYADRLKGTTVLYAPHRQRDPAANIAMRAFVCDSRRAFRTAEERVPARSHPEDPP